MDTTNGGLTAELVHNVAFAKPPIGKRGYNEDQVDAFLDLVEAALRDPAGGGLSPEQVRNVVFAKPPLGRRGYNEDQVDAFLDFVAQHLQPGRSRPGAVAPPPSGRLSARHGAARHAGDESWLRRAGNAVIQLFTWILQD
jgi:DivIVA domain-containing protein